MYVKIAVMNLRDIWVSVLTAVLGVLLLKKNPREQSFYRIFLFPTPINQTKNSDQTAGVFGNMIATD